MLQRGIWMVFRVQSRDEGVVQYWGIPGEEVREIVHRPRVYPVPRVPDVIAGCLWYRGRIYTVISAGRMILGDRWQNPSDMNYYIAVLNCAEAPLALEVGSWLNIGSEEEWIPLEYNHEIPTLATGVVGWFADNQRVPVFLLAPDRVIQWVDRVAVDFARKEFTSPMIRSRWTDVPRRDEE